MGVRIHLTRHEAREIAHGRLPDSVIRKVMPKVAQTEAPVIPGQTNLIDMLKEDPCPPNPQD